MSGKRWSFARGRDMTGTLRGNETKRTSRRRGWLMLVTAPCIGGLTGSKAAEDKAGLVGRRSYRHAKPDARHHRLDGKRIGDTDGQKATFRSRANKLLQPSH